MLLADVWYFFYKYNNWFSFHGNFQFYSDRRQWTFNNLIFEHRSGGSAVDNRLDNQPRGRKFYLQLLRSFEWYLKSRSSSMCVLVLSLGSSLTYGHKALQRRTCCVNSKSSSLYTRYFQIIYICKISKPRWYSHLWKYRAIHFSSFVVRVIQNVLFYMLYKLVDFRSQKNISSWV